MQNETNMQDLFPAPNPFRMEQEPIACYRRDKYPKKDTRTPDNRRYRRRLHPNAIVSLALVLVLAIAFMVSAINANLSSGTSDALWATDTNAERLQDVSSTQSTPQSEWKQGSVPTLFQTDPQWASRSYAGATIGTHGCGPTCLSMVYIALTGKGDLDPNGMAKFSTRCGYLEGEETSWLPMTEGAGQLGLRSRELSLDIGEVKAALSAGAPLILSMGSGDFTDDGHFIVVCGVDEDGNFIVHDPNSAQRTMRTWDPQQVLNQCRNIWAFSV